MAREGRRKARGVRNRALVTGASVGIGAAFTQRLAHDGYDLIIVARDRRRLDKLARQLRDHDRVEVEILAADLTEASGLHAVERAVADAELDLLVNNAGFGTFGRFAELDVEQEDREIRLNVLALVRLTRAALPGMVRRKRGSIINVSSLAGMQPAPFSATYAATKAFVNSFTEALHEELRGTGVRLQALCPGFTKTEFQERAGIATDRIPALAWMTAEAVVDASMAALRGGDLICVPGVANRLLAAVSATIPRSVVRRVAGALTEPELTKPRR
jgi:short-subunit dehydrogenase